MMYFRLSLIICAICLVKIACIPDDDIRLHNKIIEIWPSTPDHFYFVVENDSSRYTIYDYPSYDAIVELPTRPMAHINNNGSDYFLLGNPLEISVHNLNLQKTEKIPGSLVAINSTSFVVIIPESATNTNALLAYPSAKGISGVNSYQVAPMDNQKAILATTDEAVVLVDLEMNLIDSLNANVAVKENFSGELVHVKYDAEQNALELENIEIEFGNTIDEILRFISTNQGWYVLVRREADLLLFDEKSHIADSFPWKESVEYGITYYEGRLRIGFRQGPSFYVDSTETFIFQQTNTAKGFYTLYLKDGIFTLEWEEKSISAKTKPRLVPRIPFSINQYLQKPMYAIIEEDSTRFYNSNLDILVSIDKKAEAFGISEEAILLAVQKKGEYQLVKLDL